MTDYAKGFADGHKCCAKEKEKLEQEIDALRAELKNEEKINNDLSVEILALEDKNSKLRAELARFSESARLKQVCAQRDRLQGEKDAIARELHEEIENANRLREALEKIANTSCPCNPISVALQALYTQAATNFKTGTVYHVCPGNSQIYGRTYDPGEKCHCGWEAK